MPYRPGFQFFHGRFGAITSALVPASVASGLIGTCTLVLVVVGIALVQDTSAFQSLDEALLFLIGTGGSIALGTIAGTVVVAFYLLIFGWPIAFLLGDRIRGPIGLCASIVAACTACLFAFSWISGRSPFGGGALDLELFILIAAFAVPASFLYRRYVIAALDDRELA